MLKREKSLSKVYSNGFNSPSRKTESIPAPMESVIKSEDSVHLTDLSNLADRKAHFEELNRFIYGGADHP